MLAQQSILVHIIIFCLLVVSRHTCRANEHNEQDRLSSMITRWLNHDLECSWSKLATAVKGMRRKHAGPGVAKKLLQSIGLRSGMYTMKGIMVWRSCEVGWLKVYLVELTFTTALSCLNAKLKEEGAEMWCVSKSQWAITIPMYMYQPLIFTLLNNHNKIAWKHS